MRGAKMCNQPLAVKEMFIYLHKKHHSLVPQLSQALVEMKKDGSYQTLFNKYLMPFNNHSKNTHDGYIKK